MKKVFTSKLINTIPAQQHLLIVIFIFPYRHSIEKEHGSGRLWDEITGFYSNTQSSSASSHLPPHNHHPFSNHHQPYPNYNNPPILRLEAKIWWRQPLFDQDESLFTPSPPPNTSNHTPSSTESTTPRSTPTTPSSSASPSNDSPPISPEANLTDSSPKTRWQVHAEKLFALLLKIPYFNLSIHMQSLLRLHHQATRRKDAELYEIIRNYLNAVL